MPDVFTFSKGDIDAALGTDSQRLLDAISLKFGDLRDENPEHFFMNNPTWRRPLIDLGNGTYFVPVLTSVISFFREIMESLIDDDADLVRRYEAHRGQYLEREVARVVRESFGPAQVVTGTEFVGLDGRDGQNDVLALIDQFALVIEAKSGAVHPTARRGGELRLERTISDLIVDPSRQSERFTAYLRANPGQHDLRHRTVAETSLTPLASAGSFGSPSHSMSYLPSSPIGPG